MLTAALPMNKRSHQQWSTENNLLRFLLWKDAKMGKRMHLIPTALQVNLTHDSMPRRLGPPIAKARLNCPPERPCCAQWWGDSNQSLAVRYGHSALPQLQAETVLRFFLRVLLHPIPSLGTVEVPLSSGAPLRSWHSRSAVWSADAMPCPLLIPSLGSVLPASNPEQSPAGVSSAV